MKIIKNSIVILFFLVFLSCQSTPSISVVYNAALVKDPVLAGLIDSITIERLQEKKELSLYHNGATSLEGIEQLEYLKKLDVRSHYIEDLSPLEKLLKLKELKLSIKNIEDLDLKALREALPKCEIIVTDYKPVYIGEIEFADPGMVKAIIDYYKTKNLIGKKQRSPSSYFNVRSGRDSAFVLELADIVDIKLELTGVTRLQGLEELPKLKRLDIFEQSIADLNTIKNISSLKNAVIALRETVDITDLKASRPDIYFYVTELPFVVEEVVEDEALKKIIEEQFNDVSSHIKMNLLKSLVVSEQVTTLSGLEHAVNLTSFKMENSPVTDISPLSGCKSLVDAVFDSCYITDFSPLKDGLLYLQRIEIFNNRGDIDFSSLPKRYYKKLIVKDSNISDISGLEDFAVSNLDLSGNEISDISNISSLRLVEALNLKSNNISDISSISSFNNLQNLDLSYNKIEDDGLYHLPVMLQTLNIENNNINSYEGLVSAPNLKSVFIYGNPTTILTDEVLQILRNRRVLIGGMTNNN